MQFFTKELQHAESSGHGEAREVNRVDILPLVSTPSSASPSFLPFISRSFLYSFSTLTLFLIFIHFLPFPLIAFRDLSFFFRFSSHHILLSDTLFPPFPLTPFSSTYDPTFSQSHPPLLSSCTSSTLHPSLLLFLFLSYCHHCATFPKLRFPWRRKNPVFHHLREGPESARNTRLNAKKGRERESEKK